MARAPSSPLEADIAAALEWWREAGVDAAFVDEPLAWLAQPQGENPAPGQPVPTIEARAPEPPPQIGGLKNLWPQDLTGFRHWWMNEPSLDEGGLSPRVAAVGEAGAELMVLVAMPEDTDRDTLLGGRQGALLDGFFNAAGIDPAQTYRAALLPRHTPLPDWRELFEKGMASVLAHHVALVQPKRLLVLGRNILPFCGHDPSQGPAALSLFKHDGGMVPALAEVGLDRLLSNAQSRARLWKRWLDWTDGTEWQKSADGTGG